ncbi:putative nuclease of the RNAse H fold, HicB family [Candidatus Methanophagaceae archaeon]|nr:putative nuclease of the RNAse H fold, HicB family [Methanophagales archaeon]
MRTYIFKVAVEQDEDKWVAYSPELKDRGGATWGETKEEALKNLQEVIRLVLEDMVECRELPSFEMEMKKIVIEDQAKWTVNDLKRLKIIE